MSVFMQPIYTQTVGAGGAAFIAFNNIPQGFTDLKLVMSLRSTATGSLTGGFIDGSYVATNNTLANQSWTFTYSGSAGPQSARGTNSIPYLGPINGANTTASTFSNCEVYIANYNTGNFKTLSVDVAAENNSSTNYFVSQLSLLSRNTVPVTSIQVYAGEGVWAQYSTITLYGISNVYDTQTPTAPTIGTVTDQAGFASVAFTPAANDQADSYVVTSTPAGSTTYGAVSPIATPAVLDTSYTYQVASVNALGSSASTSSSALTTFNSYASIATITLGSANTVTFNNIPQNYSHLQLRIIARGNGAGQSTSNMQFNGSGASIYGFGYHFISGNGSSSSAGTVGSGSQASIQLPNITSSSETSGNFGVQIIDILDYANVTKFKTIRAMGGYDANGSGITALTSGYYGSFSPVSAITFAWSNSPFTFAIGSSFALYGIA